MTEYSMVSADSYSLRQHLNISSDQIKPVRPAE